MPAIADEVDNRVHRNTHGLSEGFRDRANGITRRRHADGSYDVGYDRIGGIYHPGRPEVNQLDQPLGTKDYREND